ncbi:MAG: hypothetical protein F6K61_12025 [Sphaerospermopsis sp. SIO1G1]|nr:hypothetical protein [Sphaerospermopsis sp. SIO1G1]
MTNNLISTNTDNFLKTLITTATAYQNGNKLPAAKEVVDALLAAEKAAKQQKLNYSFNSLMGKWRLCFVTGTKKARQRGGIILGKGIYIPKFVSINISFSSNQETVLDQGEVGNQVKFGAISLELTGPLKYPGKKNLLAFDFTQMKVSLFNRRFYHQKIRSGKSEAEDFYSQSIGKQAFFAFFLMTENLIAARGRGGGLAIWIREN